MAVANFTADGDVKEFMKISQHLAEGAETVQVISLRRTLAFSP